MNSRSLFRKQNGLYLGEAYLMLYFSMKHMKKYNFKQDWMSPWYQDWTLGVFAADNRELKDFGEINDMIF